MPAWRARAHHLTRSRVFLAKASAAILGVSALVAVLLNVSRQHEDAFTGHEAGQTASVSWATVLREGAKRLADANKPAPARLIAWIRLSASQWAEEDPEERSRFDAVALRLGGIELHPLIAKHTTSEAQHEAIASYVRFCFLEDSEARRSALNSLYQIGSGDAPPLANEMLGDVFSLVGESEKALEAYLREIATPTAVHSRRRAFELALMRRDEAVLDRLCSDERLLSEMDPASLWKAAKVTGDRRLLFSALWRAQWARWMQGAAVPLALLAASIWYVILIHTASRERMRWWRYLPAVFAGVASVWLLHWWQGTLNYGSNPGTAPTPTHEILQWIMHVGLPEEGAKLCLFAFFLPVLLHHRSGVKAALTAGCVGLGFALDENLHYFRDYGTHVAITRLLTANFMHISLTGILGWHLFELFRTRFHHATEFLAAFCLIVAAHGIYDFSLGAAAMQWGFDITGMIILGLSARVYLHLLHQHEQAHPAGHAISRTAVFILGTSLLAGILMVVMVWQLRQLAGITLVLQQLISIALVGLFYVREWRELD